MTMKWVLSRALLTFALSLFLLEPSMASTVAAGSEYVLPETETWELTAADGSLYRIFVSRPEGEAPAEGYPVLYVLDGNAMFAGFAETRRIQQKKSPVAQSIVVGVGYPTDQPYDYARRLYDFTPAFPEKMPASQAALTEYRAGGQEQFLDFLLTRLRSELAKRYTINSHRQALFGHSLGGLFALHVLYTRPDAFHAIISASPSQWWNDQEILAEERAFAARLSESKITGPVARVMVVAGAVEEGVANVWDAEALAERLKPLSAYGLRSRFEIFEDETHLSVPNRSVTSALRFAFSWP